jgi:excisionase family DNA binding protein
MKHSDEERLTLTVKEAASALGISRNSVYEAIRTERLPTIRLGRRVMIPRHGLLKFMGVPVASVSSRTKSYEEGVADERSRITDLLVKLLAEVRGS